MPFAVQGLKLAELARVDVAKTTRWAMLALVLGVAVALPAALYWQYNDGSLATTTRWSHYTARLPFEVGTSVSHRLKAQGALDEVVGRTSWGRLTDLTPDGPLLLAFIATAALAIAFSIGRLRFPWWPLHPIIFFFLNAGQSQNLALSFLVGWCIKAGANKYGGAKAHKALTPVMVGLVAGEVTAALVPIVVGVVYTLITDRPPAYYRPVF
jgi:hypothetical protein